jgi:hypothetical protein
LLSPTTKLLCRKGISCDVLREYTRFLAIKLRAGDTGEDPALSPPPLVDEMWHCHILDTAAYAAFCGSLSK